jgi:hypothetical protein
MTRCHPHIMQCRALRRRGDQHPVAVQRDDTAAAAFMRGPTAPEQPGRTTWGSGRNVRFGQRGHGELQVHYLAQRDGDHGAAHLS